jgi:hypothetical protein
MFPTRATARVRPPRPRHSAAPPRGGARLLPALQLLLVNLLLLAGLLPSPAASARVATPARPPAQVEHWEGSITWTQAVARLPIRPPKIRILPSGTASRCMWRRRVGNTAARSGASCAMTPPKPM